MDTLFVNEIFGPTIQGEGEYIGTPCVFLRLANCNLACVWCDTKYAWDWKNFDKDRERLELDPIQIINTIYEKAGLIRHLVITGGEPMLQQDRLAFLLGMLKPESWLIEVETAGTIPLDWHFSYLVDRFNVSPKLENSGNSLKSRLRPDVLTSLIKTGKSIFKFVAQSEKDFDEIDKLVGLYDLSPVYIMPEGMTQEDITRTSNAIIYPTIARGYRFSTRLHIQIWGNKRGV